MSVLVEPPRRPRMDASASRQAESALQHAFIRSACFLFASLGFSLSVISTLLLFAGEYCGLPVREPSVKSVVEATSLSRRTSRVGSRRGRGRSRSKKVRSLIIHPPGSPASTVFAPSTSSLTPSTAASFASMQTLESKQMKCRQSKQALPKILIPNLDGTLPSPDVVVTSPEPLPEGVPQGEGKPVSPPQTQPESRSYFNLRRPTMNMTSKASCIPRPTPLRSMTTSDISDMKVPRPCDGPRRLFLRPKEMRKSTSSPEDVLRPSAALNMQPVAQSKQKSKPFPVHARPARTQPYAAPYFLPPPVAPSRSTSPRPKTVRAQTISNPEKLPPRPKSQPSGQERQGGAQVLDPWLSFPRRRNVT